MSDKVTHVSLGVVVSVVLSFLSSYLLGLDLPRTMGYAIVGSFCGSLFPDLVEPPRHYTHRGFFHSMDLLRRIPFPMMFGFLFAFINPRFWFLFYAGLGYGLHLIVDATTPMKLPGMKGFRTNTVIPVQ